MKTRDISLIILCGLLAALRPGVLAAQTNDALSSLAATDTIMGVKKSALAPPWSGGLDDVVKLSQSGVDQSVVLSFVQNSPVAYHPNADEILKLRDAGVSAPIITAILQRGGELRQQAAQAPVAYPAPEAPPGTPQSTASYSTPTDAASTSTAGYDNTSPGYSYPIVYSYPSYYYSSGYGGSYYYPYYYPYYYYPYYPYFRYHHPQFSHFPRPVPHNGFHGGFHAQATVGSRSPWSVAGSARPVRMMNNNAHFNGAMNNNIRFNGAMGNTVRVGGAVNTGARPAPMRSGGMGNMSGGFRSH